MICGVRVEITLSLVRALLGEISPCVRAVLARMTGEKSFCIEFYLHGNHVEYFEEAASCIEAEVIADFSEDFEISTQVLRLDSPAAIDADGAVMVFLRKE